MSPSSFTSLILTILAVGAVLLLIVGFLLSVGAEEKEMRLRMIQKAHKTDLREVYPVPTQEELNREALRKVI